MLAARTTLHEVGLALILLSFSIPSQWSMERVLKGIVIAVEAFLKQDKKVSTNKERNAPCACLCLIQIPFLCLPSHTHPTKRCSIK
jgi:hypothetical protein